GARARPARRPQENDQSEARQPESEAQAQKRERRGVLQPQLRRDVAGAPDGYEIPGEQGLQLLRAWSAAMRTSIGGWVAKRLNRPERLAMPKAFTDSGSPLVWIPPRRDSAAIIGRGEPSSRAEPASARNSR